MRSKRKRFAKNGGPSQASAPMTVDEQLSAFDGANWSERRGTIIMPSLDTREELDSFSREELTRRVRWLYNNVGFVRGIVRNTATLVGWLSPQARSGDREWNRKQEKRFKLLTGKASNFDRSGKYTFKTAQLMIQRCAKKDGDILTVLTKSEDGLSPAVAFYEAHQLANPEDAPGRWKDGVKLGKGDRHLAYGLRGEDGKVMTVPVASVIYFGAFDSPGHPRAISPLAHAVNHSIDITEIRADTKHAIKVAGLFGISRELDAQAKPTKASTGMGGTLKEVRGAISNGAGGTTEKRFQSREVWGGGQIFEPGPGESLKTVHDARPHPNGMAFQDELIRDVALGYGTTPEVIYKMGKLTGPGIRFVMDQASRWIDIEQEHLRDWSERVWIYFTAWDIVAGSLGLPKGEDSDWMTVEFIPQRDLTIDRGKDGRLEKDLLNEGHATLADFHQKMSGKSWDEQVDQRVDEVKYQMEKCKEAGIPYELAFPPAAGSAAANNHPKQEGKPDNDDEEEEDEDDP